MDFDFRAFFSALPRPLVQLATACEYCFIPVVEAVSHCRAALEPLTNAKRGVGQRLTALTGVLAVASLWAALYAVGGTTALLAYAASSALFVHVLAAHDSACGVARFAAKFVALV